MIQSNWPSRSYIGRPARRRGGRVLEVEKRPWTRRRIVKTVLASVGLLMLSLVAAVVLAGAVMVARARPTIPSVAQIAAFQPASATAIYSSDGTLLARLQMENRQPVKLKQISPLLVAATLAIEDNRFYEHSGVDYHGVVRAAWDNLLNRNITGEGASTITQQLARNVSQFGISKEKSLTRKVRETMTALRIEQVFTKDDILALYLNQIYYGSGAYGAEAAARTYFGKPASKLTLSEAALLAGLPQRPQFYSPYNNLEAARQRRDIVLKRMLDTGKISAGDYDRAKSESIKLSRLKPNHQVIHAHYFVDWIVQNLIRRYGPDAVYSGWKVVTTLDWRMQQRAEEAVRDGLRDGATQGALVSLDPHTGAVRAMVGGVDYSRDQFNAITQGKRQPGSAFKLFDYTAAFDTGALTLYSEFQDKKLEIPNDPKVWTVHNYGGSYSNQAVTIHDAIARSINTVAVQAAQETGISKIIDYAHRMGITTDLTPYLSLALGSSAVRPLDLCSAYSLFAANGERYTPAGIQSVRDAGGRVLFSDDPYDRRNSPFLQQMTIDQINAALRDVVLSGTGAAARDVPNAFGKTGTTSDLRDAWFIGYTPELTTCVWVGRPERGAHGIVYRPMPGASGGHVAAPIWASFMRYAAPLQQRINRAHGLKPWTITVPPPPQPEPPVAPDQSAYNSAGSVPQPPVESAPFYPTPQSAPNRIQEPSASGDDQQSTFGHQMQMQPDDSNGSASSTSPPPDILYDAQGHRYVRVCAETGLLATEWCDSTVLLDVTNRRIPTRYCRKHHAPAGEQGW